MNYNQRFELDAPTIDNRTHKQLIEQLNKMVPYYAPEWTFNVQDPDFGSALALIYLHLLEGNIARLNKLPYKSLITFLNQFNIDRAPATSAVANVQFKLADGTPEPVLIEKGLQLSANNSNGPDPIIFETESTVLLTTAKLEQVIAVYPRNDRIVMQLRDGVWSHKPLNESGQPMEGGTFALYGNGGLNIQEHTLYIEHPFLFQIEHPAAIEFNLLHPQHEAAVKEASALLADDEKTVWEYYSDGQWYPFDAVHSHDNRLRLLKLRTRKIDKYVLNMQEGHWIRCRALSLSAIDDSLSLGKIQFQRLLMKTDYAPEHSESGIAPSKSFFNDIPVEPAVGCEPFGDFFASYGCFYIGNQEVLGKKGAKVTINFMMSYHMHRLFPDKPKEINWKPIMKREVLDKVDIPDPVTITRVQWEYWNGRSWAMLKVADEATTMFQVLYEGEKSKQLSFVVPDDMEEIEVNAELNSWIRGRIVTVANPYSIDAVYYSPFVHSMKMSYMYENVNIYPNHFYTYNNLDWKSYTAELKSGGMTVRPFQPLHGYQPTVWFGFHTPPERGPIHLFVDLISRNWTAAEIPHVQWEYLKAVGGSTQWQPLVVSDETQSFSRSGTVQFVGPRDFARSKQFGKEQYWIRAVNRDTRNYIANEQEYEPLIRDIHLNTVRVLQQVTVDHELPAYIGGYDVAQEQAASYYALSLKPVISERVWVDETSRISTHELEELQRYQPHLPDLKLDSEGNILQVRVEYEEVEHFLHSKPTDRHYNVDRALGRITFGDDQAGRAASIQGTDMVKVSYVSGGGAIGNVEKGSISTLQNAIAFIESASNINHAAGGCDAGSVNEAIERGTKLFAHRGRAVLAEDFEWITRSIHPNIAKVKCLANNNIKMQKEIGALTIVVLPYTGHGQNTHFLELKKKVEQRLLSVAASSIAFPNKLQVIETVYVEIGVRATVWVRNMDDVVHVERELQSKLSQYLNPITGNNDGRGWEIGQKIHPSMFYALMKSVGPVVHIPQLLLEAYKTELGQRVELNPDKLYELPHSIIVSGDHHITVEVH